MKKCRVCKQPKELLAFAKDKRAKDGYQSECRQCRADRHAKSKLIAEPSILSDDYVDNVKWYTNVEILFLAFVFSYLSYLVIKEF